MKNVFMIFIRYNYFFHVELIFSGGYFFIIVSFSLFKLIDKCLDLLTATNKAAEM